MVAQQGSFMMTGVGGLKHFISPFHLYTFRLFLPTMRKLFPQSKSLTNLAKKYMSDSIRAEVSEVDDLTLWVTYLVILNGRDLYWLNTSTIISGAMSPNEARVLEEFFTALNVHISTNLVPPSTGFELANVTYTSDMTLLIIEWYNKIREFMETQAIDPAYLTFEEINNDLKYYNWELIKETRYGRDWGDIRGAKGPNSLPYVRNSKTFENLLALISSEPDGDFEKTVVSDFWVPWEECKGWSDADVELYLKLLDFSTVGNEIKSFNFPQGLI